MESATFDEPISRTSTPRPDVTRRRPRAAKERTASRMTVRETLNFLHKSRSEGRRSPALSCLARIASVSCSATLSDRFGARVTLLKGCSVMRTLCGAVSAPPSYQRHMSSVLRKVGVVGVSLSNSRQACHHTSLRWQYVEQ